MFGSYALHTDPKSEANLVCQSVCQCVRVSVDHFEDEMTRDRSPRVQVVWVLVVFKLFRRPLLPARCSRCVGKILKNFPSQLVVFVQGKLCSVSKLLYRAVYDWLSFISNRKLPALLCLVCFLLFHLGDAERTFLGEERHHIYRLALCLVQIAPEARRFRKPHSLGLNRERVAPHFRSKLSQESRLAQALTSKCLSPWTIGVGYTSN